MRCVAVDHLQLIATAEYSDREAARRMHEFARRVVGHEADHDATWLGGLPLARRGKGQITE